jgi:hypothetical protein
MKRMSGKLLLAWPTPPEHSMSGSYDPEVCQKHHSMLEIMQVIAYGVAIPLPSAY